MYKLNSVLKLFITFVGSGSSTSKQEEVKRLPGGKIKKKVRTFKDFPFYLKHANLSFKVSIAPVPMTIQATVQILCVYFLGIPPVNSFWCKILYYIPVSFLPRLG